MVAKSANRTLMLTVRPSCPEDRSRAAVFSASRSSSRWTTPWSVTSEPKVSSAPIERSGSSVTTVRGSCPVASACRWVAVPSPSARTRAGSGRAAMSPTVFSPSPARCSAVRSPTPHSAPTGSGCRKASTPSAGTTSRPSGLQRDDASLARNFVGATPTEQVIPCSSAMRARIHSPIQPGRPRRRRAPDTSRNASSSDSGSTSGVTDRNTAMTPADTSA